MKPATFAGSATPIGAAGHIALAVFAVGVLSVCALKLDPYGSGLILLSLGGMAVAASRGRRLPLTAKASLTGVLLVHGFWWCLYSRTGQAGLSLQVAVGMCVTLALFACLPLLTSFLLWPKRVAAAILIGGASLSFGAAAAVAHIEEAMFVATHREKGIGLTSRWLMPGNGLWYDAHEQRLYGCE